MSITGHGSGMGQHLSCGVGHWLIVLRKWLIRVCLSIAILSMERIWLLAHGSRVWRGQRCGFRRRASIHPLEDQGFRVGRVILPRWCGNLPFKWAVDLRNAHRVIMLCVSIIHLGIISESLKIM